MKKITALKILSKNSLSSSAFRHGRCSHLLNEKGNKTVVGENIKLKTRRREEVILKREMYKIISENYF